MPVTDLGGIITRIAASRLARGQSSQQDQQKLLERTAATAAAEQQQLPAGTAAVAAAKAAASGVELPQIVQEAMPQAWKALALCAGKMVEMFRPVAFVENKDTDTQVSCHVALAQQTQRGWGLSESMLVLRGASAGVVRTPHVRLSTQCLILTPARLQRSSGSCVACIVCSKYGGLVDPQPATVLLL